MPMRQLLHKGAACGESLSCTYCHGQESPRARCIQNHGSSLTFSLRPSANGRLRSSALGLVVGQSSIRPPDRSRGLPTVTVGRTQSTSLVEAPTTRDNRRIEAETSLLALFRLYSPDERNTKAAPRHIRTITNDVG
jgi:hypothetical protein